MKYFYLIPMGGFSKLLKKSFKNKNKEKILKKFKN